MYSLEPEYPKISSLDEIETGKGYVLVANNDPLIRIRYNTKAIQPSHNQPGLGGLTMKNEHMARIRKVTERWPKQKSFTQQQQSSFVESVHEEQRNSVKQQAPLVKAEPKKAKTPQAPIRQMESEGVGTTPEPVEKYSPEAHEEVYGAKETQAFNAREKTPRTPKPKTPAAQVQDERVDSPIPSSVGTPKSQGRSEVASPKSQGRSAIASPKSQGKSAIASPKSQARSAVMSPESQARSAVISPESRARSSAATPKTSTEDSRPPSAQETPKSKRSSKEQLKASAKERLARSPKSRSTGSKLELGEPALSKSQPLRSSKGEVYRGD